MSSLEDSPDGHVIGRWHGQHIPYALTRTITGKRFVWCRFGTLGWERLGQLVKTADGPELKRESAWQGHPLPDIESEIVERAAAVAA